MIRYLHMKFPFRNTSNFVVAIDEKVATVELNRTKRA